MGRVIFLPGVKRPTLVLTGLRVGVSRVRGPHPGQRPPCAPSCPRAQALPLAAHPKHPTKLGVGSVGNGRRLPRRLENLGSLCHMALEITACLFGEMQVPDPAWGPVDRVASLAFVFAGCLAQGAAGHAPLRGKDAAPLLGRVHAPRLSSKRF